MSSSSTLSKTTLDQLLAEMPDESAVSLLIVYQRLLRITATSRGYAVRLDLRVKVSSSKPRVFKQKIGIFCLGKQPRPDWSETEETAPQERTTMVNRVLDQWNSYSNYVRSTAGEEAVDSLLQGFQLISNTLRECATCSRVLLPITNQFVLYQAAEILSVP